MSMAPTKFQTNSKYEMNFMNMLNIVLAVIIVLINKITICTTMRPDLKIPVKAKRD